MYEYYYILYTPYAEWYAPVPKDCIKTYRSHKVINAYKKSDELVALVKEIEDAGGVIRDIYRFEFLTNERISIYS